MALSVAIRKRALRALRFTTEPRLKASVKEQFAPGSSYGVIPSTVATVTLENRKP